MTLGAVVAALFANDGAAYSYTNSVSYGKELRF